jgi:hypothetical protein
MKKLLAVLLLSALPALASSKSDVVFARHIADDLRIDRVLIHKIRVDHEGDVSFTEAEVAYHNALADLEEFQNGDPAITRERVENDALEVWMDLAPYRDTYNVMR